MNKQYIGDGVYADVTQDDQLQISASLGIIYLEWAVFKRLLDFGAKKFGVKITVEMPEAK